MLLKCGAVDGAYLNAFTYQYKQGKWKGHGKNHFHRIALILDLIALNLIIF